MTVGSNAGGSVRRRWEVRKHWNDFLVTSSVRGLKRTTTSETRFLRLFWVVFLLGSLALMLYQISSVVDTYLHQKDSTAMQSKQLDIDVPFPAVSVCREATYSSHKQMRQAMERHNASVTTPQSYSRRVADLLYRHFRNATNMTEDELEEAKMALLRFDTARSYQAQIPRAAIKEVALPLIRQIATARANFANGSSTSLASNMDIIGMDVETDDYPSSSYDAELWGMRVMDFYHWRYFLCQTLEITLSREEMNEMRSLDLLLWYAADDFNTSISGVADRAFAMRGFWSADGIRLALHPAGEHGKVHIDNGATLVRSGGYSEIRFRPSITRYLNCSDRELQHGDQGGYSYNMNDCKYLNYDEELRRQCNCTMDPLAWDYHQCIRINWTDLDMSDWGGCMGRVEWNRKSCSRPACTHTEYRYEASFAPWNINDFQWRWIVDLLLNRDEALPLYLAMSQVGEAESGIDYRESSALFQRIKNNLTSLTISRQSGLVAYQQEVRLTSIANMLSSCGGALSLFMGITLTLMAEFIEFLYKLFRPAFQRSKTPAKQQDAASDNEGQADRKEGDSKNESVTLDSVQVVEQEV
uniref:G_PROTEIN_RECEP_F3_4 domain-containing protein n=1 Tax=Macrostomum lignano TaxID=282301 RepID=A0A1I8JFJ6_9PLAT